MGRDRRESPAFLLFMTGMTTNHIVKIRKPQTRLKRIQSALRLQRKDEDNVRKGKQSLFLHLQLILEFISSKFIFPYKVYKSNTELGLPMVLFAMDVVHSHRLPK